MAINNPTITKANMGAISKNICDKHKRKEYKVFLTETL